MTVTLAAIEVTGGSLGVGALVTTLLTILGSIGVWMVRTLGKTSEERDRSSDAGWRAYEKVMAEMDARIKDINDGAWKAMRDLRDDTEHRITALTEERDFWRDKYLAEIDPTKGQQP